MDIRRVRAFRHIVEAGGLTKAADVLNMTPGALSKAMRQLEAETGKPLFAKHGRGLRLTDHGELLFKLSGRLLEEHSRVLRELDQSAMPMPRTLRLVTFEVFSTHVLGALLAAGLGNRPLSILERPAGDLETAIVDRQADVGLTYLPSPTRGLRFRPVGDFSFRIFTRRGALAQTAFDELPFAVPLTKFDRDLGGAQAIDCWPYERVPRHVVYRLTSLESALELCRTGVCAVFLPDFLAACHNRHQPRARQLVARISPTTLGAVTGRVHVVYRDADAGAEQLEQVVAAAAKVPTTFQMIE